MCKVGLALGFALLVFPPGAFAQGCVPARLMAVFGVQDSPYLKPHEGWTTVSFRFFNSFHEFYGNEELPVTPPELYANTHVTTFDFNMTYAVTNRLTLTLEVPVQAGSRETYYEHDFASLHTMRAAGAGDVRVSGNVWLFDPEQHPNRNVSVGVGLKAPTGNSGAADNAYRATGVVSRPVDPAIQPGDGGWGIMLTANAFTKAFKNSFAYFQGAYMVNPRQRNETQVPLGDLPDVTGGDPSYTFAAVPDQYLARAGLGRAIWRAEGLSGTLGVRIDGVPARDLIGSSEGFVVPGYSVAVEPGISLSRGANFFAFTVPVAVRRQVNKSVADIRTNNVYGGFAAMADYQIIVSYSRRF